MMTLIWYFLYHLILFLKNPAEKYWFPGNVATLSKRSAITYHIGSLLLSVAHTSALQKQRARLTLLQVVTLIDDGYFPGLGTL